MTGIDRIIVSSDDKVTAGEENFTVEVSRYIYDTGDFHGKMATAPGEEVGTFTGDIGFQNSPDAVTGSLGEGRFVLFFPGELHKPGVARPECTKVRKAVVKIRMEDKA